MTLHVQGRSTYREDVAPRVRIYRAVNGRKMYDDAYFEIARADLEKRDGGSFRIVARHPEGATDIEEDSAFVFVLEGAGLQFDDTFGPRVSFTGVALKLYYYPVDFRAEDGADLRPFKLRDDIDDEISTCDGKHCKSDPHLMVPYFPPKAALPKGRYEDDDDDSSQTIYVELDFFHDPEKTELNTLPVLTSVLPKKDEDG